MNLLNHKPYVLLTTETVPAASVGAGVLGMTSILLHSPCETTALFALKLFPSVVSALF